MTEPALSVENLGKTYAGGLTALNDVSLQVARGDFFALLGPNGAGKSTFIGIISSLINKTAGHVSVMGYDLDRQPGMVKRQIGLVPQEFNFNQFSRTFNLPDTVDGEKITAKHRDGILFVTVPKKEEAWIKPSREIAIK